MWCRSWNVLRGNLRTFKFAAFTGVSILRLCLQDSTVLRSENRRQYLPCLLLNIFVEWIRRSSVNLARHLHGERGILMVVVFRYLTFAFCHVDSGEHNLSCRTWNSFLYPWQHICRRFGSYILEHSSAWHTSHVGPNFGFYTLVCSLLSIDESLVETNSLVWWGGVVFIFSSCESFCTGSHAVSELEISRSYKAQFGVFGRPYFSTTETKIISQWLLLEKTPLRRAYILLAPLLSLYTSRMALETSRRVSTLLSSFQRQPWLRQNVLNHARLLIAQSETWSHVRAAESVDKEYVATIPLRFWVRASSQCL